MWQSVITGEHAAYWSHQQPVPGFDLKEFALDET